VSISPLRSRANLNKETAFAGNMQQGTGRTE